MDQLEQLQHKEVIDEMENIEMEQIEEEIMKTEIQLEDMEQQIKGGDVIQARKKEMNAIQKVLIGLDTKLYKQGRIVSSGQPKGQGCTKREIVTYKI